MTDEQHAHLSRYVRDVADALRLRDLDTTARIVAPFLPLIDPFPEG